VPGLIAKNGADGVFAAALPDGRAFALKILDGSARPIPPLIAATLTALGAGSPELAEVGRVVVRGHGAAVGAVESSIGSSAGV
jgi:L-asparaginase II